MAYSSVCRGTYAYKRMWLSSEVGDISLVRRCSAGVPPWGCRARSDSLCVLVCTCVCIPPYVDWSNALHDRVSRSAAGGILAQQHVLHFHLRAKSDVQMTEAGNELVYPSRLRPPVKNTMTVAGVGVGGE